MTRKLTPLDIGDESIDWTNVLPLSHYIVKRLKRKDKDNDELLNRAREAFAWQLTRARLLQKKGE